MIMKRCSKCGKLKNESDFPKDRTRKDGLHQRCKACKNEYSRQRYQTKQESKGDNIESNDLKKCSGCGELKARSEFSKDRTKKDGLYHLCKVCRSTYRRKNKGIEKDTTKRNKARLAGHDNKDIGVLAIVYAGDECGACSVCGESLMGYIPGYIHEQPVCSDCVIANLKTVSTEKRGKN